MNTDTIAPIAVITATPANQLFDPAEPDDFVALAEVLTVVPGVVIPCVDVLWVVVLWAVVLWVALLSVAVLVAMLVTVLLDVGADGALMDDDELPVDVGALEVGETY